MRSELAARPRFLWLGLAFALLYLAGPGILSRGGSPALALGAMALWAAFASRPGPRAGLADFLLGGLAWAGVCSWSGHVWLGNLGIMVAGFGLYMLFAGAVLRRVAARFPLALAAPAAWLLAETVRAVLPPPLGMPWMRLGTHLHETLWLAGSARVWGIGGLSWLLAAGGGLLAAAAEALFRDKGRLARSELLFGLVPAAAGVLLALFLPPPEMVPGPRVMLVQPAFPQARKMRGMHAEDMFVTTRALTQSGIEEARRLGEPEPDLVAWGETMLPAVMVSEDLPAALRSGTRDFPWVEDPADPAGAERAQARQQAWVDGALFGDPALTLQGVLPEGTAFLSGVLHYRPRDGFVRRQNAVFLWERPGPPQGPVSKLHLVPGAETMVGLERFEGVRSTIGDIADYVPDLLGDVGDGRVLAFTARDGRRYSLGVSVCFDNAFDDVFTQPLRAAARAGEPGPDFHMVVSNEAWFLSSQEADQMVAFSRLAALATGRTVVRATNSGVSSAFAPDGRELARLEVAGRDREVPGTLRVSLPVPPEGAVGVPTPFVLLEHGLLVLWIGIGAALLVASRRRWGPSELSDPLPSAEAGYKQPAPRGAARPAPQGRARRHGRP